MPYSTKKGDKSISRYDMAKSKRPRYLSLIAAILLVVGDFYLIASQSPNPLQLYLFIALTFCSSIFFTYFLLGLKRTIFLFGGAILAVSALKVLSEQVGAYGALFFIALWVLSIPTLLLMAIFAYRERAAAILPIIFWSVVAMPIAVDLLTRVSIEFARPSVHHCMFQQGGNEYNKQVGDLIDTVWQLKLLPIITRQTKRVMVLTSQTLYVWKYTGQVFVSVPTDLNALHFEEGSELEKCKRSLITRAKKFAK